MENNDIFVRVLLNEKIKLEPSFITKSFAIELKNRLVHKLEGICSRHGFIRKKSIDIYKIKPGYLELISLNGYAQYDIYFYAEVCNPLIGSIIKCKVTNINKFGILAEAGYKVNGTIKNILEAIIAKNSVNIKSDIDLDKIKQGDIVKIEVIGKKFELNDEKISVVGKILNQKVKQDVKPVKTEIIVDTIDEDAEDADEIASDVDDEDDAEDAEDAEEVEDAEDAEEVEEIDDEILTNIDEDDEELTTKIIGGEFSEEEEEEDILEDIEDDDASFDADDQMGLNFDD